MSSRFEKFVTSPTYQDVEKDLVTSLLNKIVLFMLGFTLLINIILPFVNPNANYLTSLGLLAMVIILFFTIRRGVYRAVKVSSVILCLTLWIAVTINGWSDEGLRNIASGTYYVIIIIAGLLLGGKGAILFGMLCIAGSSLLYYGESAGMIAFSQRDVILADLIKIILIEVLVIVLVRFAVKRLIHALEKLRVSERMLEDRADEMSKVNIQLRKLSSAKDEFIANVSHELRSPITSLQMYEDLLSRRPDRLEQYLPIIRRETARLGGLIDDLLSISRLQQGGMALNLESFDLNALIREYVVDRTTLAEERGLKLTYSEVKGLPFVTGDRNLLGQSISILLTNSLNYTPPGGKIFVGTESRYVDGRQWVGFVVHDTGPGISEEDQQKIFSRFYRGQIGRKSGFSGTGLGLAIAKEIVERHKGKIEVRSEGVSGKGTTFYVWLPSADSSGAG